MGYILLYKLYIFSGVSRERVLELENEYRMLMGGGVRGVTGQRVQEHVEVELLSKKEIVPIPNPRIMAVIALGKERK